MTVQIYFRNQTSPITDGGFVQHISKHDDQGAITQEYDLYPTWRVNTNPIGVQGQKLVLQGRDSAGQFQSLWLLDVDSGTPTQLLSGTWEDGTLGVPDHGPYTDAAGNIYAVWDTSPSSSAGNGSGVLRRWTTDGSSYADFPFDVPIPADADQGPSNWVLFNDSDEGLAVSPDGQYLYGLIRWIENPPSDPELNGQADTFHDIVRWTIPASPGTMTGTSLASFEQAVVDLGAPGIAAKNNTPAFSDFDGIGVDDDGNLWYSWKLSDTRAFTGSPPIYSGSTQTAPGKMYVTKLGGGVQVDLTAEIPNSTSVGGGGETNVDLLHQNHWVEDHQGALWAIISDAASPYANHLVKLMKGTGALTIAPDFDYTTDIVQTFIAITGSAAGRRRGGFPSFIYGIGGALAGVGAAIARACSPL